MLLGYYYGFIESILLIVTWLLVYTNMLCGRVSLETTVSFCFAIVGSSRIHIIAELCNHNCQALVVALTLDSWLVVFQTIYLKLDVTSMLPSNNYMQ